MSRISSKAFFIILAILESKKEQMKQLEFAENTEIIQAVQIKNPDLENKNFEKKLEAISFGKKKD